MQIEILPPQLANQIAAGEVVERPSSVVKELVENSLDAGATHIDIQIEQGGAGLILIRDNGKGIAKEDLALALCRHATSKIKNMDDLLSILSFGFRGEALASISSVSRLTLTSKTQTQTEAWQVYAEGREMTPVIKPAAHPEGTSVEVRNLFYNTPARRKFLRAEKTEFTHIDEIIKRIALIRYDVSFTLSHQAKKIREYRVSQPKKSLAQGNNNAFKGDNQSNLDSQLKTDRIEAVCGLKFLTYAQHIDWTHFELSIQAWIWPNLGRHTDLQFTKGIQYCYVNGRIVRDKVILHAIKQAFSFYYPELSASDDKLAYVIYFQLPPEQVDVNVHPAKHEVRFHQARLVHDFIYQAVVESLKAQDKQDLLSAHQQTQASKNTLHIQDENRSSAGKNQFATQSTWQNEPLANALYKDTESDNKTATTRSSESHLGNETSPHTSSNLTRRDDEAKRSQLDKQNSTLFRKKETPFSLDGYMAISSAPEEVVVPSPSIKSSAYRVEALQQDELTDTDSNTVMSTTVKAPAQMVTPPIYHGKVPKKQETALYGTLFMQGADAENSAADKYIKEEEEGSLNTYFPLGEPKVIANEKSHTQSITRYRSFGKALAILNHQNVLLLRKNSDDQDELFTVCLSKALYALKNEQLHHVIKEKNTQALLVPITLKLNDEEWASLEKAQSLLAPLMIGYKQDKRFKKIEIESVPAPLRHCDISKVFVALLNFIAFHLSTKIGNQTKSEGLPATDVSFDALYQEAIGFLAKEIATQSREVQAKQWSLAQAITLITDLEHVGYDKIEVIIAQLSEPLYGHF